MKNTEHEYISTGYAYERATTAEKSRAIAQTLRRMIEAEHQTDHAEARRLIEIGRQEARLSETATR